MLALAADVDAYLPRPSGSRTSGTSTGTRLSGLPSFGISR